MKTASGGSEKWFSVYIIRVTQAHSTNENWRGFFVFVIYLAWAGLGWLAGLAGWLAGLKVLELQN